MPNNIEQRIGNVPLNNILTKNSTGNNLINGNGSVGARTNASANDSARTSASKNANLRSNNKQQQFLKGRTPLQIKQTSPIGSRGRDYSGLGLTRQGMVNGSSGSSGSSGRSDGRSDGRTGNEIKSNKNTIGSNSNKNSGKGLFSSLKGSLMNLKKTITESDSSNSSNNKIKSLRDLFKNKTFRQIMTILVVSIVTFLIMYFLRKFLLNELNSAKYYPYLIEGTKSGKSSLVISQNPADDGAVPLYRSDNQDGAEFTYSFWMLIESMEYNFGKWKHVFHKGNKTSFPNRAPGVWILPESNDLRVYMNTYNDPLEYVDIENVPVNKWYHVAIILNHKFLDIYFNGKLKSRKELENLPRQNYGEFWSGLYGGFEGYLSKVRYFNKALDYKQIESIVKQGPSKNACGDTGDYPPYLDDDWWFDM
jgi:hypothetical protein